jgi:hypothetical protein
LGIGVTVARLTLDQLVQVRILDPQLSAQRSGDGPARDGLPVCGNGLHFLAELAREGCKGRRGTLSSAASKRQADHRASGRTVSAHVFPPARPDRRPNFLRSRRGQADPGRARIALEDRNQVFVPWGLHAWRFATPWFAIRDCVADFEAHASRNSRPRALPGALAV